MPMFTQFSGISKPRQINLSGRPSSSQPSNSETLLAKAREERRARERNRLEITSASCIQRVWRGRRAAQEVRDSLRIDVRRLIGQPELGSEEWMFLNRALMIILWNDRALTASDDDGELLVRWCRAGTAALDRESYGHCQLPSDLGLKLIPHCRRQLSCFNTTRLCPKLHCNHSLPFGSIAVTVFSPHVCSTAQTKLSLARLTGRASLHLINRGSPNAEIVHYLYRFLREDNWKSLLAGSNDNETMGSALRKRLIESLIEGKRGWVERLVAGMQHIVSGRWQRSSFVLPNVS